MSASNITCFTCRTHSDVEAAIAKLSASPANTLGIPQMVAVDFEWSMDGRSKGKAEVIHIGKESSPGNYECFVFVLNAEMVSKDSPLIRFFKNDKIVKVGYGSANDLPYCLAATGTFPIPYVDIQSVKALTSKEPAIGLSTAAYKMLNFTLPAKPYMVFEGTVDDESAHLMALDNYSIYKIAEYFFSPKQVVDSVAAKQATHINYELPKPVDAPAAAPFPSPRDLDDATEWLRIYLNREGSAKIRYRVVNYMSNAYGPWVKKYANVDERRRVINALIDKSFNDRLPQ